MDKIKEQVMGQVWGQGRDRNNNPVWYQVLDHTQVKTQVRTQVWHQVKDQVWYQVYIQVHWDIWESLIV